MKKEYCKAYGLRNTELDSTRGIINFDRRPSEIVPGSGK
jgi:hypothetical protein